MDILIIDDSRLMRRFLEDLVSQIEPEKKHNVICFSNGKEAFDYVSLGKDIDIILTDVKMPVMDGLTFLRKVRELLGYRKTPVIVITSSDVTVSDVILDNYTYLLKKPYNPEILKKLIRAAIK